MIKEIPIELNTGQKGSTSVELPLINGYLEDIFIDTEKPIQIEILLEKFPIIIYQNVDQKGLKHIPLPIEAISDNAERFMYSNTKLALNDKLKINVKGPFNTKIKMLIRYNG